MCEYCQQEHRDVKELRGQTNFHGGGEMNKLHISSIYSAKNAVADPALWKSDRSRNASFPPGADVVLRAFGGESCS